MKFFLLVVAFLAVGAVADDEYFVSEEDGVKLFDAFWDSLKEDYAQKDNFGFLQIAERSFDKHCMYNKYKDANLLKFINAQYIVDHKFDKKMIQFAFLSVSVQCSNKADVFAEFLFENLLTYHIIYKSVMKEPALRNFTHFVNYANKYAVDNHYIDETIYGTKVNFDIDNEDNYSEFREIVKIATGIAKIGARKEFMRTCAIGIISHLEKLFAHTILLIQFDLTFDQKKQERENFIKRVREIRSEVLPCAATPRSRFHGSLASKLPF
jgi:hypothetical protein